MEESESGKSQRRDVNMIEYIAVDAQRMNENIISNINLSSV